MRFALEHTMMGVGLFAEFAPAALVLLAVLAAGKTGKGKVNPARYGLLILFFFYLCCVTAFVFLPLPDAEAAANLNYRYQLIPFYWVYDLWMKRALCAVDHIGMNVLMTMPLGMFLRYYHGTSKKKTTAISFLFALFIEVGQLSGLFFSYHGSYRLFDVDDLITNTLGGLLGCLMVCLLEGRLPKLERFDIELTGQRVDLPAVLQIGIAHERHESEWARKQEGRRETGWRETPGKTVGCGRLAFAKETGYTESNEH